MRVRTAIGVGIVALGIVPLAILLGVPGLLLWTVPDASTWVLLPAMTGGFLAGWLWWSLLAPAWRLWAYRRVDRVLELKYLAEYRFRLVWPEGHFLSQTEVKSLEHAEEERRLEQESLAEYGAFIAPPARVESPEERARAHYLVVVPIVAIFLSFAARDKFFGEIDSRTNFTLLLAGSLCLVLPVVHRSEAVDGWPAALAPLSILLGIGGILLVDYASVSMLDFVLPALFGLGGMIIHQDRKRRDQIRDSDSGGKER